jgi:hypothetical protein
VSGPSRHIPPPCRWAAIVALSLLLLFHPAEAAAEPVIFPCHEARIIGLLDPYGTTRDIVPGWRCSGLSISDRIDITLRRGDDRIDVVLHDPGWDGEAAYHSPHFRIAVRAGPTVTAADLAEVGQAVATIIASNDRRTVWYESAHSPFPIEQPRPCVSSLYLLLAGCLLVAFAAVAFHGCVFARSGEAALKEPLPALPPREWGALAGLMAIAAVAFLVPSYLRYANYGIRNVDIGIYTHAFWNALHGHGLFNSLGATASLHPSRHSVLWRQSRQQDHDSLCGPRRRLEWTGPLSHPPPGGLLRDALLGADGGVSAERAEPVRLPSAALASGSVISPQHIQPHLSDRPVSAYFNGVADLAGDHPPFEYAVVPAATRPLPTTYELAWQGSFYSLFRLRAPPFPPS